MLQCPMMEIRIIKTIVTLASVVQFFLLAEGDYVIELELAVFKNPDNHDYKGNKCDVGLDRDCEHYFRICIDHANRNSRDHDEYEGSNYCDYFDARTKPVKIKKEDGIIDFRTFEVLYKRIASGYENSDKEMPNPIIMKKSGEYPGKYSARIKIFDQDDIHADDTIDIIPYTIIEAEADQNKAVAKQYSIQFEGNRPTSKTSPTTLSAFFWVYCDVNYYTSDCSKYCVPTESSAGHYDCDPDTGDKICMVGYKGEHCNIRSCEHQDVQGNCHSGTCVDIDNGWICSCPIGYTGQFCETEIDECSSDPCMNGGECNDNQGYYTCDCDHMYTGVNCELHVCDDPTQAQCFNGGVCVKETDSCLCPPGWAGNQCEENLCDDMMCYNGGVCDEGSCECPDGFQGIYCEHDECDLYNIECENGGTCVGGECDCPPGTFGEYCEFEAKKCEHEPCLNDGECFEEVGGFRCECPPQVNGTYCEYDYRPTLPEGQKGDDDDTPIIVGVVVSALLIILLVILLAIFLRRRRRKKAESAGEGGMSNYDNPVFMPPTTDETDNANNREMENGAVGGMAVIAPTKKDPSMDKAGEASDNERAENHYVTPGKPLPISVLANGGVQATSNSYEGQTLYNKLYDTPPSKSSKVVDEYEPVYQDVDFKD